MPLESVSAVSPSSNNPANSMLGTNGGIAPDRFGGTLNEVGVARVADASGSYQQAVEHLARACSDGAAACPFVGTRPSRKARKRPRHRQHGGVQGTFAPSASHKRGGRFLRDLRDYPSRLIVIPAECAALAGAVHVPNHRAFRPFHFHFYHAATCGISIARSPRLLIPGRC
jgi:hypothetical protein